MKRKIAIALILVLLMSVVVGTLVGCDNIVTMNASRDANQIVATVNYAGRRRMSTNTSSRAVLIPTLTSMSTTTA